MNTKIYIEAAKLIDSGRERFSCLAIFTTCNFQYTKEEKFYAELFGVNNGDTFNCLYKKYFNIPAAEQDENELREIKVIALCFAAAYFSDKDNFVSPLPLIGHKSINSDIEL